MCNFNSGKDVAFQYMCCETNKNIHLKNKTAETKLTQEDAVAAAGFFKRPWESFETRKSLIYSIRDKETLAAVEKELGMSLGLWLENNYKYAECKDLVRHVRQFM